MKKIALLALTALTLFSCSKGGSNDATPTTPTPTSVTISGTDYPIVKIGTKTWTSSNYNGDGGVNYAFSTTNNATYGKLYTMAEAKAISLPTGWRLPTRQDFIDLLKAAGTTSTNSDGDITIDGTASTKLRSVTVWTYINGTNTLGFNAYPVGVSSYIITRTPQLPAYSGVGHYTDFWASDVLPSTVEGGINTTHHYALELSNYKFTDGSTEDYASVFKGNSVDQLYFSLRFVKDN
ncbi:FISUMP domain-containing protein [Mucilaginibacter polytrichastri]|uniref:Fibrobacter succinogenes major paralogous domain-containing protein n=1 Tax=Mucilaginibacter polytrichastri TaxID=1302689 RepID=A0A1Q5ZVB7_9SPHI|nr:FISUMP domain-containing protein [Mucilaginibacter polytrichastri]OKS85673.1 hypothetical protein RG47T_1119 [Mucilaginibacter polytrichastri]SFS62107.1 major paralogous domain-containing protein [Mucilaginibacter polytrichastri]